MYQLKMFSLKASSKKIVKHTFFYMWTGIDFGGLIYLIKKHECILLTRLVQGIILSGFAQNIALRYKHFTGLLLLRKAIAVVIVIVLYL